MPREAREACHRLDHTAGAEQGRDGGRASVLSLAPGFDGVLERRIAPKVDKRRRTRLQEHRDIESGVLAQAMDDQRCRDHHVVRKERPTEVLHQRSMDELCWFPLLIAKSLGVSERPCHLLFVASTDRWLARVDGRDIRVLPEELLDYLLGGDTQPGATRDVVAQAPEDLTLRVVALLEDASSSTLDRLSNLVVVVERIGVLNVETAVLERHTHRSTIRVVVSHRSSEQPAGRSLHVRVERLIEAAEHRYIDFGVREGSEAGFNKSVVHDLHVEDRVPQCER